ncbi:MAG: hypothetical protein ABIJ09_09030 [Pseudomonadota bacterium]
MVRNAWGLVLLVLGSACLTVPPEQPPAESPRKATAVVDHTGRTIEGGNLTLSIPAGAIPEGERIQVTIDEILGAPEGHVSDAYLVQPEGYTFLEPVKVTYRYTERMVRDVADLTRLFVGTAQGPRWQLLGNPMHDLDGLKVSGQVLHFSVFGLVDPSAPLDGGFYDATPGTDAATGQDRAGRDASGLPDSTISYDAAAAQALHVQLVWSGPHADVDLHLYRSTGVAFSNTDDCYYANCKTTSPDWPPTGPVNNPLMDIDDTDGLGPENINMDQPESGSYVVGVHVYSLHSDPLPITFEVKVFQGATLRGTYTREITACDQFFNVVDLSVSGSGSTLNLTERSEAPFLSNHGAC